MAVVRLAQGSQTLLILVTGCPCVCCPGSAGMTWFWAFYPHCHLQLLGSPVPAVPANLGLGVLSPVSAWLHFCSKPPGFVRSPFICEGSCLQGLSLCRGHLCWPQLSLLRCFCCSFALPSFQASGPLRAAAPALSVPKHLLLLLGWVLDPLWVKFPPSAAMCPACFLTHSTCSFSKWTALSKSESQNLE